MSAEFFAGAGLADVQLPAGAFPLDHFTGERDALQVRALLLASGDEQLALVVVDQISLTGPLLNKIVDVTCERAHLTRDRVLVLATHTFSAPHIFPPGRVHAGEERQTELAEAATLDAVSASVNAAHTGLTPAKIGSGTGRSAVNVNRDVLTRDGWWLGSNDSGFSDHSIEVVRIDSVSGDPIAVLANYPVQPSVMHESIAADGGKLVSADLAGAAMRHVERECDGAVAFFLLGAAADQAPRLTAHRYKLAGDGSWSRTDVHEAGFLLVDLLGEQLGTEVVRARGAIDVGERSPEIRISHQTLELAGQLPPKNFRELMPTWDYKFIADGTTEAPVMLAKLGDIALVAVQVELCASTGVEIKQASPFAQTLVITLANGSAKYMADESAYDRGTYAAMNTSYARGAAEMLTDLVAAELRQMDPPNSADGSLGD